MRWTLSMNSHASAIFLFGNRETFNVFQTLGIFLRSTLNLAASLSAWWWAYTRGENTPIACHGIFIKARTWKVCSFVVGKHRQNVFSCHEFKKSNLSCYFVQETKQFATHARPSSFWQNYMTRRPSIVRFVTNLPIVTPSFISSATPKVPLWTMTTGVVSSMFRQLVHISWH